MFLVGLIFSILISIKGGWIGTVFKNWNKTVDRCEENLETTLAILKAVLELKKDDHKSWLYAFLDREFIKGLIKLPFHAGAKWFFDGSIISVFGAFVFFMASIESTHTALLCTFGFLFILVSMGEEAGAVGDYKGAWGPYIEKGFGRNYGIKKSIQYGVYGVGVIGIALGSFYPWLAGASFPLCYWIGSSFYRYIHGARSWTYAEPLWGAVLGLGIGGAIYG